MIMIIIIQKRYTTAFFFLQRQIQFNLIQSAVMPHHSLLLLGILSQRKNIPRVLPHFPQKRNRNRNRIHHNPKTEPKNINP